MLEAVHAPCQALPPGVVDSGADIGLDSRQYEPRERGVVSLAKVDAIQVLHLGEVQTRRRAADGIQPEPGDGLVGADDLVVAVAPAQAQEVVAQGRRQVAHVAIGLDAEGAVALRQLGAVGAVDKGNMGEGRCPPAAGVEQVELAKGVGQVVVAADDVADLHVMIVDHHRQHVGRGAVGAQQDEVVEPVVGDPDLALDPVIDDGLAVLRHLDTHDRLHVGGRASRVAVAPATVVEPGPALGARAPAHLLQLLLRAEAAVGFAVRQEPLRHLGVAVQTRGLELHLAVPVQLEPAQAVDDGVGRGLGRPGAVRVLDAQQEPAVMVASEQPVEQRRARAADVQVPGG